MEKYIKMYIENITKKKSQNTVESYERDLKGFFEYIVSKNIIDVSKISEVDIMMYFAGLEKSGKSNNSIIRYISVLKSFFEFLSNINAYDKKVDFEKFRPKAIKKEGTLLSKNEYARLIECIDIKSDRGLRDKIIILLMYYYGLKATTILNIEVSDIDINVGILNIGRKTLSINAELIALIKAYLVISRSYMLKEEDSEKMFVSSRNGEITRQAIWKIINKYKKRAGIEKEITANTFHDSYRYHKIES